MRGILEPDHLILILLVVFVLFGGKKIPELAGGLGKGIREFKRGMEGDAHEPPNSGAVTSRRATTASPSATGSLDEPERAPRRLLD